MSETDRICGEKRDGEDSAFVYMDEVFVLSLFGSGEYQRRAENNLTGN